MTEEQIREIVRDEFKTLRAQEKAESLKRIEDFFNDEDLPERYSKEVSELLERTIINRTDNN